MPKQYALSLQQFTAVSKLAGTERYSHFVARVADWEGVWGLRNEAGWVSARDNDGNTGFPVWPHPDYAIACATGEWANNSPSPIEVHEFVDEWLPNMAAKGVLVAVFPTSSMSGVMVSALELQASILEELSKIE